MHFLVHLYVYLFGIDKKIYGQGISLSSQIIDATFYNSYGFLVIFPLFQMSKCFNKKSHLDGHIPLGSFNSMFNFTGPWKIDAATTKSLAMDGFFIPLYKVILTSKLILKEEIQKSIPHTWEPESLSRSVIH